MYRLPLIGLNTYSDPAAIAPGFLVSADNVDMREPMGLRRRKGLVQRVATAGAHSLWSTATGSEAYYVDSGYLKRLNSPTSAEVVTPVTGNLPTRFAKANDTLVFVNSAEVGFVVNGTRFYPSPPTGDALAQAEAEFVGLMSELGGQCVAYYRGRLYVADGPVLYYSNPYDITTYDKRNFMIPLPGYISMVAPAHDGLWVASVNMAFLGGENPESFTYTKADCAPAIYGTDVETTLADWRDDASPLQAVAFVCEDGFVVGGPGGLLLQVSKDTVVFPSANSGRSLIRSDRGQTHMITTLQGTTAGTGGYEPKTITVDTDTY